MYLLLADLQQDGRQAGMVTWSLSAHMRNFAARPNCPGLSGSAHIFPSCRGGQVLQGRWSRTHAHVITHTQHLHASNQLWANTGSTAAAKAWQRVRQDITRPTEHQLAVPYDVPAGQHD